MAPAAATTTAAVRSRPPGRDPRLVLFNPNLILLLREHGSAKRKVG
jgi:hypothetical protein